MPPICGIAPRVPLLLPHATFLLPPFSLPLRKRGYTLPRSNHFISHTPTREVGGLRVGPAVPCTSSFESICVQVPVVADVVRGETSQRVVSRPHAFLGLIQQSPRRCLHIALQCFGSSTLPHATQRLPTALARHAHSQLRSHCNQCFAGKALLHRCSTKTGAMCLNRRQ
jgi:hypothetical protein